MTSLNKSDKTFMGLPVEGSIGNWSPIPQSPIEELYVYFKNAFDHDGVKAIMWEQYTPGWNDGEPCEFSIRDPKVTTNKVVADAWINGTEPDMSEAYPDRTGDNDYYDEWEFESYSGHPDGEHVNKISIPVADGRFEDALRAKFGNDIKIIVTVDRVVTEEYDCGY